MNLMILFLLLGYSSAAGYDEMGKVGLKQHIAILQQQMDGNPVDGSIVSRKYNNMLRTKDDIRDPVKVSNFIHVVSAYGSIIGSAIQSVVTTHGEGPSFQTNLDSYLTERINRLDPSLQGLGKDMKNQFQDIRDSLQQIVDQKIDLNSYFFGELDHPLIQFGYDKWSSWETSKINLQGILWPEVVREFGNGQLSILRDTCWQVIRLPTLNFVTFVGIKTEDEINYDRFLDATMAQSLVLHLSKAMCRGFVYRGDANGLAPESFTQMANLYRYTKCRSHWTLTSLQVLPRYANSFSHENTLTVSLNGGKDQLKYPLDWTGQALTSFVGELELETRDFVLQFKNDEYSIGNSFNWTSEREIENAVVNPNPSFFKQINVKHICLPRMRYVPRQTYNSCVYGDGAIHMIFKTQDSKHCYDTMNYILNHQEVKDLASQYTFSYTFDKTSSQRYDPIDCGIRFSTKEQLDVYFQPPEGECHEQKGHPEGKYKDKDRFMATLFSHKVKEPQQFDAVYHMPAPVPTLAFTAVPRPSSDAAASLTFITRLLIISSIMMLLI